MLMKYPDWNRKQPSPCSAVSILFGTELCLLDEARQSLRTQWLDDPDAERRVISLNKTEDWEALFDAAHQQSLFNSNVIIEAFWEKATLDSAIKKILEGYLVAPNPTTRVIIVASQLKTKVLESLAQHPHLLLLEMAPYPPRAAIQWIHQRLQQARLSTSPELPECIFTLTEGNLLAARSIIDKLRFVLPKNAVCSREMLLAHLEDTAQFSVYALADACLEGTVPRALQILESLLKQDELHLILWILAQTLRQLTTFSHRVQRGENAAQIAKSLKIWSSQLPLFNKALRELGQETIVTLLTRCHILDRALRSSQRPSLRRELEIFVVEFASRRLSI